MNRKLVHVISNGRGMTQFMLVLSLLCFPLFCFAAPDPSSTFSDISTSYLASLFGNVGHILAANQTNGLVGKIMGVFNNGILVVISVWLMYTVGMYAFRTALNGSVSAAQGGKSDLAMLLLKLALGVALVVPVSDGYCVMQHLVMEVVVQGVKLGDKVWKEGIDYLKGKGGLTWNYNVTPTAFGAGLDNLKMANAIPDVYHKFGLSVYEDMACAYDKASKSNQSEAEIYKDNREDDVIDFGTQAGNFNECGSVSYDFISPPVGRAAMLSFIQSSNEMVKEVVDYLNGKSAGVEARSLNLEKLNIASTTANFMKYMVAYAHAKKAAGSAASTGIRTMFINHWLNNWIYAGAYYWYLVELTDESHLWVSGMDYVPSGIHVTVPVRNSEVRNFFSQLADSRSATAVFSKFASATTGGNSPLSKRLIKDFSVVKKDGEEDSSGSTVMHSIHEFVFGLVSNMIFLVGFALSGGDTNPIMFLHRLGMQMLEFGFSTWVAFLGISMTVVSKLGLWNRLGNLQTGIAASDAFLRGLNLIIGAVCLILFSSGFLLAYYLPFYPFILFTICVIGWLISCVEAMVAAPFVCLRMTHPEGHDFLDSVQQAIMLLLSVFVQPALLIVGLFIAVILSYVSLSLVIHTYLICLAVFITSVPFNTTSDMFVAAIFYIASLVFLIMLCYFAVTKSFSLVYLLRDNVLRWIGVPQSGLAPADQEAQRLMGGVSKAGAVGSVATGQAMGSVSPGDKNTSTASMSGDTKPGSGGGASARQLHSAAGSSAAADSATGSRAGSSSGSSGQGPGGGVTPPSDGPGAGSPSSPSGGGEAGRDDDAQT